MKTEKMMRIVLENPNMPQQIVLSIYRHGYKTIKPSRFYYVSGIFHSMAVDVVQINRSTCREMLQQAHSNGWKTWIQKSTIYA